MGEWDFGGRGGGGWGEVEGGKFCLAKREVGEKGSLKRDGRSFGGAREGGGGERLHLGSR